MHGTDPVHCGNPIEQLLHIQFGWTTEHQHANHAAYFSE